MSVGSVLVAGGGIPGSAAAIALARRGVEVAVVERGPRWPGVGAGTDDPRDLAVLAGLGVTSPEPDDEAGGGILLALQRSLTALDVEVRTGVDLLGVIDVDSHVEAELSNGRVENFDAVVVVADDDTAATVGIRSRGGSRRVMVAKDAEEAVRIAERLAGERAD